MGKRRSFAPVEQVFPWPKYVISKISFLVLCSQVVHDHVHWHYSVDCGAKLGLCAQETLLKWLQIGHPNGLYVSKTLEIEEPHILHSLD